MGKLGNACRARAAECVLAARAVGWRGDNAQSYVTPRQPEIRIYSEGGGAKKAIFLRDFLCARRGRYPCAQINLLR
jgi:hypothetical protein